MTGSLRVGSAGNPEHGDIVTTSDRAYQNAHPAAAGERPSLYDLDLPRKDSRMPRRAKLIPTASFTPASAERLHPLRQPGRHATDMITPPRPTHGRGPAATFADIRQDPIAGVRRKRPPLRQTPVMNYELGAHNGICKDF